MVTTAALAHQAAEAIVYHQAPPLAQDNERGQNWKREEIQVVLDSSLAELGPDAELVVEEAFHTWEITDAAIPIVSFVAGSGAVASLEPDGINSVLVAPIEFEGHESDLAITIGFSNPVTGEISEADIVINSRHVFAQLSESEFEVAPEFDPAEVESCTGTLDAAICGQAFDLQNVITHEVGHFYGLGENYDDPRATMFSCTSACEHHKRDLAQNDIDWIVDLYSATPEDPIAEGPCGLISVAGGVPDRTGLWLSALALFGLSLLWRRNQRHERLRAERMHTDR